MSTSYEITGGGVCHPKERIEEVRVFVDFHMRDEQGRVSAFVGSWPMRVGDIVLATDVEGNRCKARVDEVSQSLAYLTLIPGTTEAGTPGGS